MQISVILTIKKALLRTSKASKQIYIQIRLQTVIIWSSMFFLWQVLHLAQAKHFHE